MDCIALYFKNPMGLQHILAQNVKTGLRESANDKEFLPEIHPTKMY